MLEAPCLLSRTKHVNMWACGGASPFELPHQTFQLLLQAHNTLQRGARAKLHVHHSDPLTGDNYAMTDSFHCCTILAWSSKLHVTTWCSVLRVTCFLWESGQLLKLQQTERDKSPEKLTENTVWLGSSASDVRVRLICRPHPHQSDDRRWDQIPGWMAPLWQVFRLSTPALLITRGPLRFGRTRFLVSGIVIFSPSGQRLSKHLPFEHWVTKCIQEITYSVSTSSLREGGMPRPGPATLERRKSGISDVQWGWRWYSEI